MSDFCLDFVDNRLDKYFFPQLAPFYNRGEPSPSLHSLIQVYNCYIQFIRDESLNYHSIPIDWPAPEFQSGMSYLFVNGC